MALVRKYWIFCGVFLASCSNKVVLESYPNGADVVVSQEMESPGVTVGVTPVEIPFEKFFPLGQGFVTLKLKDGTQKSFWVTRPGFGRLQQKIVVQLKPRPVPLIPSVPPSGSAEAKRVDGAVAPVSLPSTFEAPKTSASSVSGAASSNRSSRRPGKPKAAQ